MKDFSNSVMLALLPTTSDWCRIDLPHMTLVSVGEIPDLRPTDHNELAKVALDFAMTCPVITLVVTGTAVFGEEDKVEVLTLLPTPQLVAMRSMVEGWDSSNFPFNPHCTVGPVGSITPENIPDSITFDRIAVGWGDSLLPFKLI